MRQGVSGVLLKVVVNLCRLLLAGTFVFSGFVKANDPYGMMYKVEDYLTAWGLELPGALVLVAALVLAFVEFIIGLYLLFGISARSTARITVGLMTVMTLLTVYIAIYNPVSDCGCFGDALILTNTETLLKNIVLLAAAVVLFRYHDLQIRLLSKNSEWVVSVFSNIYVLGFAGYSLTTLPVFDFRPYHIGADIREGMVLPDSLLPQYDVKVVYERDGKTMELDIDDDDPDSTWTYVETKRIQTKEAGKPLIADFYMLDDSNGGVDLTEMILADEGYNFLLVAPRLEDAGQGYVGDINNVYDYAVNYEYGFYCLTASDSAAQELWTDHTGAEYPFLRGDERTLKTIVRSSPGLVLLKDGKVMRKCSVYMMPDGEVLTGRLEDIEYGKADFVSVKGKIYNILLWFFIPLGLLTLFDRLAAGWSFYRRLKHKAKELQLENIEKQLGIVKGDEKAEREEVEK